MRAHLCICGFFSHNLLNFLLLSLLAVFLSVIKCVLQISRNNRIRFFVFYCFTFFTSCSYFYSVEFIRRESNALEFIGEAAIFLSAANQFVFLFSYNTTN